MAVSTIPLRTGLPGFAFLGAFTWAGLPAAASYSGFTARVSDVGISPGMLVVSDGTRWIPAGVQVLSKYTQAVSGAADTNENTLGTISVPANLLGLSGGLRIMTRWTVTNGANNKSFRLRFSGAAGTQYLNFTAANFAGAQVTTFISNRGAANSQIGGSLLTASNTGVGAAQVVTTSSVDTTAATTVLITGQKATGSDTMTLEEYIAEIIPGG